MGDSVSLLIALWRKARRAVLAGCALFGLFFFVSYALGGWVIADLASLLGGLNLYQTMVGEALVARVTLSFALAAALIAPVAFYIVLRLRHVKTPLFSALGGAALLYGGAVFARVLLLPMTIGFLLRTNGGMLLAHISLYGYVVFCVSLVLAVGVVFELPLALRMMHGLGMVSASGLRKARARVVIGALIVVAILTPSQDAVTLVIACAPVLLLYEASILWIAALERGAIRA